MKTDARIDLLITLHLAVMFLIVVIFEGAFVDAHRDGRILAYLSDASVYFDSYVSKYAHVALGDDWTVFLRTSPVLLMIAFDGNLALVQLLNAVIMSYCLWQSYQCFERFQTQLLYVGLCLLFPYFTFGFLGLNKEVYAVCSAMLFATFATNGSRINLAGALILALMARYYMLSSLLLLLVTFPRNGSPRFIIPIVVLIFASIIGPLVRDIVPQYSHVNVVKNSGETAVILSLIVDNFGYVILYPLKYALLLAVRPLGFLFAGNDDAVGACVSLLSMIACLLAAWHIIAGRQHDRTATMFLLYGFVAPIPMMWSDIMHWRYYSFVYIFFVFAICLMRDGLPRNAFTTAAKKAQLG